MEKSHKFVVFFGKICMCYPLVSDEIWCGSKPKKYPTNPFKIFQAILCIYLVTYAIDFWSIDSPEGLPGRNLLSAKLCFFMQHIAEIVSDTLIRISTLYYWTELPQLYSELLVLWKKCKFIQPSSSQSTKVYICLISVAATADLVSLALVVYKNDVAYQGSFVAERKSRVVPQFEVLMRLVDGIIVVLSHLSFVYATICVAFFGPLLTDVYVALLEGFQREFLGIFKPLRHDEMVTVTPTLKMPGGYAVGDSKRKRLAMFTMYFASLHKCLTIYMNVSECYLLTIVFRCAVSMNLALVNATGISDNSGVIPRGDYLLFVGQIVVAVLMADIGTTMRMKVDQVRKELKREQQLRNQRGGQEDILRALAWAVSWKCNLTAFRIFPVDRRLLLGIGQTVLVVVIFMFQLRLSEYQSFSTW